ncbi:MAG TPA: hypothetical protein VFD82_24795 [Planctomycetota bacterium]|nr:hypothetical protein [Planctomycetota bacterium]
MDANKNHAVCLWMSALAVSVGATGMVVSFGFLASVSFEEITAGMSGFVAGAILIGSGLVALALLSRQVTSAHTDDSGNRATMPSK